MDKARGMDIANGKHSGSEGSASVSYGRIIPTYAGLTPVTPGSAQSPASRVNAASLPPAPQSPPPYVPPSTPQQPPAHNPLDWGKIGKAAGFALLGLLVLGAIIYTAFTIFNRQDAGKVAGRFTTVEIPLAELIGDGGTGLIGTRSLVINGALQANSSVTISPSRQPSNANRGQLYYDQDSNQLAYFNGAQFVQLGSEAASVQSVGGQTGQIAIGEGLTSADGSISNSGVLSLQGQTGNITLTAGSGIAIDGTTLTNTGVTSLAGATGAIGIGNGLDIQAGTLTNTGVISAASGSANITVTNDGNGNITISSVGGGTGTVQSPGGTPGRLAKFTGVQTLEDSLISEGGATVTVNGSLSVLGGLSLANALTVGNGGTGTTALANNGVVIGQGSGALTAVTAASPGLCFMSSAGAPQFTACPGAAGVSSVNGQTGAITIANANAAGGMVTINDAGTSQKGIASFNGTNFTVSSGSVNTVQNIHVAATPTFGALNLTSSQSSSPMLLANNTNTSATGNLIDLQLNGTSRLAVSPAGNMTLSGTVNGQTISSAASFTGSLAVAGAASLNGGASVTGTLTANTITPTAAMSVGATSQSLVLQGNTSTTLRATNGASTTTLAFQAPTANVTYRLLTAAAGTYDICTTAGNCAGIGGGVTTAGGTTDRLAKFTGSQAIGDSIITDNGTTVTIGGILAANTITPTAALTVGATAQDLTLQGASTTISATVAGITNSLNFAAPSGSNKAITVPNASGTLVVSASGPLAIDANGNISCTTCAVTGTGVSSLNGLTGALSIANATGAGSTITIQDASTSQKGLASFNSTNFTVTNGAVNTVQDISVAATPTFGRLSVTSSQASDPMLLANNTNAGATGNLLDLQLNGTSRFSVTPAGNVTAAGTLNGQTISSSANLTGTLTVASNATVGGTLTVSGGTATLGTATQAGAAILYDGSSNTATIQTGALGQNTTFLLPDPGAGTATFCLTTGNCAGLGGSITGSGTTGKIAKFTASGSIGDSILTETTNLLSVAGGINIGTGNTYQINGVQISSGALSNDTNLAKLDTTQTFTGDNSFTGNMTLGDTSADTLTIGAVLQGATPLVFEGGTADANELSLAIGALTADRTITLGDESGTICLQSSTNCGFAAATGGTGYIQNQTAAAQLANFYIQSAAAATTPTAALRLASGQTGNLLEFQDASGNIASRVGANGFMHIDRAAATSDVVFTVKSTADTQSRLTISADGKIGWGSGSAPTDNFITRTVAGALEASNQFTVLGGLQVGAPGFLGKLTIQGGSTSTVSQIIRAVASQTADQIQLQDSAGNINASFNAAGNQLTLGRVAASGTVTQGRVVLADGTTSNASLTLQTATLTANHTITLPNETGIVCLQGSTTCGFAATSGSANYIQNTTTQQTANMNIISAASGSVGARIEGAANMSAQALLVRAGSNPSANAFEVQNSAGGQIFGVDSGSTRVVVGNGNSCTGRLCVGQSTSGTGGGVVTNLYNINAIAVSNASTVVGHNIVVNDTSTAVANTIRPFIIDTTGTTNTAASINAIQVKLPASALGTALQIQNGATDIVNIDNSGATTFQGTANSANAFRVLSQGGGSLFNLDATNGGGASLLGLNSGEVSTWATTSQSLPAARYAGATVASNGYVYYIGGNNTSNVAQSTVYSAKLNSDGTIGTWTTLTGTPLPEARARASAVVMNGYVYVIGGVDGSGNTTQTTYVAKLYPDGTMSSWFTTENLPSVRRNGAASTANGYVYYIAGQDGSSANATVYYAKARIDGKLEAYATTTAIPQARYFLTSASANGYLYAIGGTNTSNVQQSTVYYAKLNANGTVGAWTTASNPLSEPRAEASALVMNGYLYAIGGANTSTYQNTVLYSKLHGDGSLGTWTTATNPMGTNRASAGAVASNGYLYMIGGFNGSTGVATVTHTNSARVQIGGSLDLVGLQGQGLTDPGDGTAGSTGGSLTAGNGTFVGSLNVQGLASFNQGVAVNGGLNVLGDANVSGDLNLTTELNDNQGFESTTFVPTGPGAWTTGGNVAWERTTTQQSEGAASASNGDIGNSQSSWMDLDYTFTQDGMLQFSWRVNSEESWDYLFFCVDNDTCTEESGYTYRISGFQEWVDVTVPVSAGTHSFRWTYSKDETTTTGADRGWVDNIRFTGGTGKVTGNFLTLDAAYGMHFDTNGYNITIGEYDDVGALLVLDQKFGASDPVGINGAMYYNDTYQKFRCFENYEWKECINTPFLHRFYANAGQSVPVATDTKINFATSEVNDGDISVSGNNTFTLNKPGIWAIDASVRFGTGTGGTGERYLTIATCVASGQPLPRYGQTTAHQGGSYSVALSTSATQRFADGAQVCIYGYQNSGASLNTDASWNGTSVSFTWLGY